MKFVYSKQLDYSKLKVSSFPMKNLRMSKKKTLKLWKLDLRIKQKSGRVRQTYQSLLCRIYCPFCVELLIVLFCVLLFAGVSTFSSAAVEA